MYERMLDKQNKPAFDDMAAYRGKGMELFIRINEWLSDTCFHLIYDQVERETQECIDNKYPCGDGGWIHCRVAGEAHFCDIQKLLEMKCLS